MRRVLTSLLFLMLLIVHDSYAQQEENVEEFRKTAQLEAQKMNDFFEEKKFDKFLDYLRPKIIETMGERSK